MDPIRLAFSTCPNDTFIFDAMVHGKIANPGLSYELHLADISELNRMAMADEADMIKVSYNSYGQIRDRYHLLDAGSALGHNCGPLLISKRPLSIDEIAEKNLRVLIPGFNTTANLLLQFFAPEIRNKEEAIFSDIMPALAEGRADAGVIIHENRFTYPDYGLQLIQDLGEHWEAKTGLPIPLGGIVVKKNLGAALIAKLERQMRDSVAYAFAHPEASTAFVRAHAQELDPEVAQAHISLYVNEYSLSLGERGRQAVDKLLAVGDELRGVSVQNHLPEQGQ